MFNENQIRQAIENFQKTHPVAYGFDVSHIDSKDSLDIIKREVDRLSEKVQKDTEIYIIFEMAKQYLNGARPTISPARPRFRHVTLNHPRFGKCDACYDEKRMLFYTDPITAEILIKYNWTWEEADNETRN